MPLAFTTKLTVPGYGPLDVTIRRAGHGQPVLLLHGGLGPRSITRFADELAQQTGARVVAPTHPGFDATHRPAELSTIRGLADLYCRLLDRLDLSDVTVVGSCIGGWIAAELSQQSDRVARLVLANAVGIDVADHPVCDFHGLDAEELLARSYHDPARFRIDDSSVSRVHRRLCVANQEAHALYAGSAGMDPTLLLRLAQIQQPTMVVWGESDRLVDLRYGRAYAAAIPQAEFRLLPACGHHPALEAPHELVRNVQEFVAASA